MVALYIDPGVRACGVSMFQNGRLVAAGLVEGSKSSGPNKTATEGVAGSSGRPVVWTAMADIPDQKRDGPPERAVALAKRPP